MKITNKEDGPILPVEGENNVLITSALPCGYQSRD